MKKTILMVAILLSASVGQAQIAPLYKSIQSTYKGPFGLNYLQGSSGRISVRDGASAPGGQQFQAAFRNDTAMKLEALDFYMGNLYTTNYYELMGEYVYGKAMSSHPLNHQGLLDASAAALPKASSMVRHWLLEKHFVHQFPSSNLAQSFKLRGISGSEFEQEYARYFLNFYVYALTNEKQLLTALLLAKGSPIATSSSLERARNLIAASFDSAVASYGPDDSMVKALYQLRNSIHNQLTQSVIAQIDAFQRQYSSYGDFSLGEIRSILVAYYSVSSQRVSDAAKKIGASDIQASADALKKGSTVAGCLDLSLKVAALRSSIMDNRLYPADKKTDVLLVLITASQYLNKEMNNLKDVNSKDVFKVLTNLVYIDGFLIKDNWNYFTSEIDGAADVKAVAAILPDMIDIANDTLTQAFAPALQQWISVEPKMQYFVDNTIKSSSLNTLSVMAGKIKR